MLSHSASHKRSSVSCREVSRPEFGPGSSVSHVETRQSDPGERISWMGLHLVYGRDLGPQFGPHRSHPAPELRCSCIAARYGAKIQPSYTPHMANCKNTPPNMRRRRRKGSRRITHPTHPTHYCKKREKGCFGGAYGVIKPDPDLAHLLSLSFFSLRPKKHTFLTHTLIYTESWLSDLAGTICHSIRFTKTPTFYNLPGLSSNFSSPKTKLPTISASP